MIYKITDEQHFQVLSDSFSVSPSETGYELYFSANGVEFSPFTTVAAGQNKQFVNMANGNYYYLSGNVGDVEVNWEKDCGGGGGGGTAGVSSLDGQTGALTTKTINGEGILGTGDIEIEGGGNYVIVDALSAITSPVSGMVAYVKEYSYIETIPCYKVYRKEKFGAWGDLFRIMVDGNEVVRVYQDGSNYIWDYVNDGEWHTFNREYNGVIYPVLYRTYNDSETPINSYFTIDQDFGGLADIGGIMTFETSEGEDVGYREEYNYQRNRIVPAEFYQYIDGEWKKLELPRKIVLDEMTDVERAALFLEIQSLAGLELGENNINDKYQFFATFDNGDVAKKSRMRLQYMGTDSEWMRFGLLTWSFITGQSFYGLKISIKNDGEICKEIDGRRYIDMTSARIVRDVEPLDYEEGTFTGYTLDLSQATGEGTDGWFVNWYEINPDDPGDTGRWMIKVRKDGDDYKNGDWTTLPADGVWRKYNRTFNLSHTYYYQLTSAGVFTVVFAENAPSSISDMHLDTAVTYSTATQQIDGFYRTDSNTDYTFWTGNTCSNEWQGDWEGFSRTLENGDIRNNGYYNPPSFRVAMTDASGNTVIHAYPTFKGYKLKQAVTFNDKEGNPHDFRFKCYLYYKDFTISYYIDSDGYRYAQLTLTPKPNNVVLTQAQYDALVQAGTVDPNTIYTII